MVADDPVVVGANRYRFAAGERIVNPRVMSMSFIWVLSGSGEIAAGGRRFQVEPRHVVRLPWRHAVEYEAACREPFHVGTLHVLPRHARSTPVVPQVAFQSDDPLLHDPARSGDPSAFRAGIASTADSAARRIVEFGTIAIERLAEDAFDEEYFRALGRLVLSENAGWDDRSAQPSHPGSLELMLAFMRFHLAEPLTVAQIAAAGHCSATTAQRLFVQYKGEPMQSWLRRVRLGEAASLLRTTGLRVNEVARLVGYSDPLYFSRAFRRAYGVAPSHLGRSAIRP